MLSEGDAETDASFSGISRSVLRHLRAAGDRVATADCDLRGWQRLVAAAPVFSTDRARWQASYHLLPWPARFRSAAAARHLATAGEDVDAVLQIGATFELPAVPGPSVHLYCDSNIRVSQRAVATGVSWAGRLTESELSRVLQREQRVYDAAAHVFTLSEYLRQSFLEDFHLPPEKVIAVGAGPNIEPSRGANTESDRAGSRTILFIGADFIRKGGDILLQAFERVRQSVPDAQLVLIGPPEGITEQTGVRSLGYLSKEVPAQRAIIERELLNASLFCLPTRFEPFGIAYVEAMHFALPCVGTQDWAVPELIDEGSTGFLVPRDDVTALAARLELLLGNPDLAGRMGQAGRAKAEARYTWPHVVRKMRSAMLTRSRGR